jgi:hypothetical protein
MDGWKDIESSRINDEYLLHSCRPKTEKNRNAAAAAAIGITAADMGSSYKQCCIACCIMYMSIYNMLSTGLLFFFFFSCCCS